MRRTALGILIASTAWTIAAGQDGTARDVFDRMTEALGGRSAVEGLESLVAEAVCSGPGGKFVTRVRSERDGSTYFRQASSDGETEIWSTERGTWSRAGDGSRRPLPDEVRAFVRGHEFHLLVLEVERRFSSHRVAGTEEIEERPVIGIDMEDEEGRPATIRIDAGTYLPRELVMNPEGAEGPIRIVFEDWEPSAGVQLFRSFRLFEGAEREFRYDYVLIDTDPAPGRGTEIPVDLDEEREAILAILQSDRRAHLETDAVLLGAHLAEEIVEVSDGAFRTRSREDVIEQFTVIFSGAAYLSWDDVVPPRIRFSVDGSMAWVVRTVAAERVDVRGGEEVRSRYTSAYTATYEKDGGRWRMTSVTSTFVPDTRAG